MKIIIKPYQEKYFPQVAQLFDEFQGFIAWIDPLKGNVWRKGFGEVAVRETIQEVETNEGFFLLALDEDKVVGFVTGIIKHPKKVEQFSSAVPQDEGRITELYLSGEYQHQGIGKKLIAAVDDFFKEKQIKVIRVEVFVPNENARKFYEKIGFKERSLDLVKTVE